MEIHVSPKFQNDDIICCILIRFPNIQIIKQEPFEPNQLEIVFESSQKEKTFQLVQYLQTNHKCIWDIQTHIKQSDRFLLICPWKKNELHENQGKHDLWVEKCNKIQKIADRLEANAWKCRWHIYKNYECDA